MRPAQAAARRQSDVPDDFAALLFGRAAPEDLVRYDAARARGARRERLGVPAARKPGAPKIRFEQPTAPTGERLKSISVIEIVNDDMPFLVDSVMAELTERGLGVAPGRASDLHGRARQDRQADRLRRPRPASGKDEARESFIHIHVERIEDAARRAEIVQALGAGAGRGAALRAGLAADDRRASTR